MLDSELLYLYLVVKNDWAFNFLYDKYQQLILLITKNQFHKFFTIPLELNDLTSIIYFAFCESVFCFHNHSNKSFRNYFLDNVKWQVLKYLSKYISKNHQIINLSFGYHEYLVNNISEQPKQNLTVLNEQIDACNLTKAEKNVFQLKQVGFSNDEIMQQLNLSYKQIDNALQRANNKIKSFYQKHDLV